jgi:peptide/nickel transport system substrate-binding protein
MDPKVDAAPLRLYFSNIKSCEVLDPYTVRFTATERYFKTLEALGAGELPILPKHAFDHGDPNFNRNNFGRAPIGTGPYKFVKWETGSQIVLERNDDYWGPKNHYPKRIVFQVISEPSTATQLLKKGEIDVINGMNPIQWERELAHTRSVDRIKRIIYPFPAYSYLGFNLRKPIFSDVRVRHAIDLLIPRSEILSRIYLNQYASECSGYDAPASPDYNHDVPPTPEDPVLAQKLLSEAGWKNDHGDGILYKDNQPLSFTVVYPAANLSAEKILELMQESMSRAGIKLQLDRLEFPQLIAKTEDWKFDATLAGWALDVPNGDPYQLWHSSQADIKQSSNFIGFKDPAADKLIAAGRLEYDDAKRAAIYRQLQKVIHDDYPVCFLFNPHTILVYSNRFQNVKIFAPRPCFDITTWWVPRPLQKYN